MKKNHGNISGAKNTLLLAEYEQTRSQIFSRKVRRRRELAKYRRKAYYGDVGTLEVERQLNDDVHGLETEYVKPAVYHEISERRRLVDLLCDFRTDLSENDVAQRRLEPITNMIALCCQSEPRPRNKKILNATRTSSLDNFVTVMRLGVICSSIGN